MQQLKSMMENFERLALFFALNGNDRWYYFYCWQLSVFNQRPDREETISDGSENNSYCIKCYYIYSIICWSSAQGAFYTLDLTLNSVLWFSAFVYSTFP